MKIRFIKAKTILNRSRLPGGGYTLNPFLGCPHGCVYCYNQQFMPRIRKSRERWGQFLDIKINGPEILRQELIKKNRDWVFLSTVTDPYNPFEAKYQTTRRCLEVLLKYQWPVSILTKSDLVLRDLDLLKQFEQVEVGFTFTTLDDKIARLIEPHASLPSVRLDVLNKLHQAKIRTYAFVAPILPKLTDLDLIFRNLKSKVDEIWLDSLNTRKDNWQGLKKVLNENWPNYVLVYEQIFFKCREKYKNNLRREIEDLSQKYYLPVKICF